MRSAPVSRSSGIGKTGQQHARKIIVCWAFDKVDIEVYYTSVKASIVGYCAGHDAISLTSPDHPLGMRVGSDDATGIIEPTFQDLLREREVGQRVAGINRNGYRSGKIVFGEFHPTIAGSGPLPP